MIPRVVILLLVTAVVGLTTSPQVITQMGKENMKIPAGEHRDEPVPYAGREYHVELDSAAVYYAMLDSAQVAIEQTDWPMAEQWLRNVLSVDADNATNSLVLSNLATVQRYQGKNDEALKNYTLALDLTPNAVTLLLNRAALLLEMGQTHRAVLDYEHVTMLDATDAESRYSLGMIAVEQGDYERARVMFDEIERNNPKSALANEGRGFMYKAQGDYARAAQQLSIVIKSKPDAHLLGNRADCYLALKRLNDAASDIHAAIEQSPNDPYLYVLRAKLNKLRYNYTDMQKDIDLAVSNGLERDVVNALLENLPK